LEKEFNVTKAFSEDNLDFVGNDCQRIKSTDFPKIWNEPRINDESPQFLKEYTNITKETYEKIPNETKTHDADDISDFCEDKMNSAVKSYMEVNEEEYHLANSAYKKLPGKTSTYKSVEIMSEHHENELKNRIVKKRHIHQFMNKNKLFRCNICNAGFTHKSSLKRHVASVHERKKLFKCEICHYSASTESDMKKHVASVREQKKLFKCDLCNTRFIQKSSLKRHVVSVHEQKNLFECESCDYCSSMKSNVRKHFESIHEKKKPFKCDICDYSSSKKSHVKRHVRLVHDKKKRERSHSNVIFVTTVHQRNLMSKDMLD